MIIHSLFWLAIGLILYTYFGYLLLLWLFCALKRNHEQDFKTNQNQLPEVTIITAAHNEEKYILSKYQNTVSLDYPANKVNQVWVDDGSTDNTRELLLNLKGVNIIINPERIGKAASINKAMEQVQTPIAIFTDANTFLSRNSIIDLVKHFQNPRVGCVAGQKSISWDENDTLASKGEGMYWKYESFVKTVESCTGSTLSGTGELYAIRTNLFKPLPQNTILDDFEISANIIKQGYQIKYEHKTVASETGSLTVGEEKKRKIRIAAGCFQALARHANLLYPVKNFEVAFKFFSHKILRWIIVPMAILILPILNGIILFFYQNQSMHYIASFVVICSFYVIVFIGYLTRNSSRVASFVTFPYYGFMMNIAMLKGLIRFTLGKQSHIWERANRKADI